MKNKYLMISIIIATYNRKKLLSKCLNSIWNITTSLPYEVIVVDDGSIDGTWEYLKNESSKYSNLICFQQKNQGQATARNKGVNLSNGNIIAFTDDDCIVSADWLLSIKNSFNEKNIVGTEGPVLSHGHDICNPSTNPLEFYIHNKNKHAYITCNLAFRKNIFIEQGGFDIQFRMHEDTDLCLRILKTGDFYFNKKMIIYHPPRKYQVLKEILYSIKFGKNYLISEYLLYEKNKKNYSTVRYYDSFEKTFFNLSFKYAFLYARCPIKIAIKNPFSYLCLILIFLFRQNSIAFWYLLGSIIGFRKLL